MAHEFQMVFDQVKVFLFFIFGQKTLQDDAGEFVEKI